MSHPPIPIADVPRAMTVFQYLRAHTGYDAAVAACAPRVGRRGRFSFDLPGVDLDGIRTQVTEALERRGFRGWRHAGGCRRCPTKVHGQSPHSNAGAFAHTCCCSSFWRLHRLHLQCTSVLAALAMWPAGQRQARAELLCRSSRGRKRARAKQRKGGRCAPPSSNPCLSAPAHPT